jgi:hypothetical protein
MQMNRRPGLPEEMGCQGESKWLEVVLKPHLRPNGCVVPQIEMLTY